MSSHIQNILEQTLGDGARSTKYEIFFSFPYSDNNGAIAAPLILAKTTNFPAKQHVIADVKYKGRSIPVRGQVKYTQTWECSFYLSQDHSLKYAFENWIEALDGKHNYMQGVGEQRDLAAMQLASATNYSQEIKIFQRDFRDEHDTAEYTLHNVFPIEISPIQAGYENIGQLQEFTVTFSYSYFTMRTLKGAEGNFIDNLVSLVKDEAKSVALNLAGRVATNINSFIDRNISGTLDALNDFANGLTDVVPVSTDDKNSDLITGSSDIQNTIFTEIEKESNSFINDNSSN